MIHDLEEKVPNDIKLRESEMLSCWEQMQSREGRGPEGESKRGHETEGGAACGVSWPLLRQPVDR